MKKLYQLKTLLSFVTILYSCQFISFAMILDTSTTAKCYTPVNYGTPSEEVVDIPRGTGSSYGRCIYNAPSFLVSNPNDPRKYICGKVQKCIYTGLAAAPIEPAGEFMYILADPGVDSEYTSALSTATGGSMALSDKAYLTLAECQADNQNRIIGVQGSWVSRWADMSSCLTVLNSSTGLSSAINDGGCTFAPPGTGKQDRLILASVAPGDTSHRCSCTTTNRGRPPYYDIYVENPDGSKRTYFSGLSTDAGYDDAKINCFNSNTNRFYSSVTNQCFSDLNACKDASRLARSLSCTEAQAEHLFLVVPSGTKTEYLPTDETTKRNQVLDCIKTGKTQDQCINTYFGAGPTSTGIGSDDFYRCKCEIDYSNPLCIAGISGACTTTCKLNPTAFMNVSALKKVVINSPLQFIKVLSNFLFYAAIVIFIINFLLAGLQYVRSEGQADALKTAQARITNSIGGLIFIMLVGALLNYLITILAGVGFQA